MNTAISALAVGMVALTATAQIRSYHLGNSLTWDSQPLRLWEAYGADSQDWQVEYHIKCGSSLPNIMDNPFITCNGGFYLDALPASEFDYVFVQTHYEFIDFQSHLSRYVEIFDFIDMHQSAKRIMYFPWPRFAEWDTNWIAPHTEQGYQYEWETQKEFVDQVNATRGIPHYMSPAGLVLWNIRNEIAAGNPDLPTDFFDFYRDTIHASDLGRTVANMTNIVVATGESPALLNDWAGIPQNQHQEIKRIVWDTVLAEPRTGIQTDCADITLDGAVDISDLLVLLSNFGSADTAFSAGNINSDNDVDISDLLLLLALFDEQCI